MKKLILLFLPVLTFCSCEQEQADDSVKLALTYELHHDDLHSPTALQGQYILKNYRVNPSRILAANNYLFIVNNSSTDDRLLTCFDLSTDSVNYFIERGEGPFEMESIYAMQYYQDSVFIFDRSLGKGFVYAIAQFDQPYNEPIRTIRFDQTPMDLLILSDGSFIATSYSSQYLKRIWYYDQKGNFQQGYISYPNTQIEGIDSIGIPQAYVSNMTINHKVKKFAIANQSQDLIEIYREDFDTLGFINGPDFFLPAYESEFTNGMHQLWPIDEEIRDAYFSIQSDDKELFVLYSGGYPFRKGESSTLPGHMDQLFVFDWQGNFIRNYQLDIPIKGRMTVDFVNRKIYGISDAEDTGIVMFDF